MSGIATSPVGDRAPRFAAGFGRASAVLSALALLVAVGMSLPDSWFAFGGNGQAASPTYSELKPSTPVRLAVGDVVTPLVASELDPRDALADRPADAPLVTWWSGSAKPGSEHGQTVLTGHATEDGGALSPIAKLDKGDFVDVLTKQGTMRYEVTGVRSLDPDRMAAAAAGYFKQDGGAGRLVMASAEGWDGAGYQRSVVVTASPLGQPS